LEIKSKKLTNHLFTGEYHTAFKGRGMTFKEVKEYTEGDDVRFIDWNVSARMGSVYSKVFEEERELSVFLLIDASASHLFGSGQQSKRALIAEMAAVLASSAASNNDKVGVAFCTEKVEKYIPPKKGRAHVLYIMRELLRYTPQSTKTNIAAALQLLNHTTRQKSIVFVLSDFADDNYEDALKVAAKRHDVIGIQVYDPFDAAMPDIGLLAIADPETGRELWMDTSNKQVQEAWKYQHEKNLMDTKALFKKVGCDLLQMATGQDYVKLLQQFFIKRA
jgi:uncharacterized protein (DUF58 family)